MMEPSFMEGEVVEISLYEEPCRGAWFPATLVKELCNKSFVVEYQWLGLSDEIGHIRATVDSLHIRPCPPKLLDGREFDVSQEVDAFYNPGWWSGIILQVLPHNTYNVFSKDWNELKVFHQSELRFHMQWINGEWIQASQRNKKTVEVSFDDEKLCGAWFPATTLKEIGDGSFLVECSTLRFGDNVTQLKAIVDSRHIRPSPPTISVCKVFDVLQKVDAFRDFGWWNGVITSVLTEERYIVFFKHKNEEKECKQSELRHPMEWTDDKWLPELGETSVIQPNQGGVESPIPTGITAISTEISVQPSPSAVEDKLKKIVPPEEYMDNHVPLSSSQTPKDDLLRDICGNHLSVKSSLDNVTEVETCEVIGLSKTEVERQMKQPLAQLPSLMEKFENVAEADKQMVNVLKRKRGRPKKTPVKEYAEEQPSLSMGRGRPRATYLLKNRSAGGPLREAELHEVASSREMINSTVKTGCVETMDNMQEEHRPLCRGRGQQKAKVSLPKTSVTGKEQKRSGRGRGRPKANVSNQKTSATGKEHKRSGRGRGRGGRPKGMNSNRKIAVEGASPDNQLKSQYDKDILLEKSSVQSPELQNSYLSKCSFKLEEHRVVEDQCRSSRADEADDSVLLDPVLEDGGSVPFIRRSPLWKDMESWESFRSMPQHPHFQPLKQLNEELREGSALGYMMNFDNLVIGTCKARLNEDRSVLENKLKALSDLEAVGFNVKPVQARLEDLLIIKDTEAKLDLEVQVVEEQIVNEKHEEHKLKVELEDTEGKLKELQESITQVNKKWELISNEAVKRGSVISELHETANTIKKEVRCTRLQFETVAAAPW